MIRPLIVRLVPAVLAGVPAAGAASAADFAGYRAFHAAAPLAVR